MGNCLSIKSPGGKTPAVKDPRSMGWESDKGGEGIARREESLGTEQSGENVFRFSFLQHLPHLLPPATPLPALRGTSQGLYLRVLIKRPPRKDCLAANINTCKSLTSRG